MSRTRAGAGGNARGWEIRPQEMKGFGCRRRHFLRNPAEEELKRKHGRLNLKENGKGRKREKEKKKTVPDVSPHGQTPVAAEDRPKQSRNVNKEVNGATMTVNFFFFFDWVELRG